MHIGDICVPHGLFLAPLAGVSDASFRKICAEYGAEYTVSEMISAKALCYEQIGKHKGEGAFKTAALASNETGDPPTAVQIFGRDPEFMAEASKLLASRTYRGCVAADPPAAIDINMGCPVHKVVSNGEGSALMKEPELCGRIVRAIADAVSIPVTVKIRAGWSRDSVNAVEVAKIAEANGAAAICVHARTREQMYEPGVDRSIIAEVKRAVNIPVIANGDIFTAEDALLTLEQTGADGLMIARGALGNPWIFEEISAAMDGKVYASPDENERIRVAIAQLEDMIAKKGERVGLAEAKKHMAWYTKGMRGSADMRSRIMNASTADELVGFLNALRG